MLALTGLIPVAGSCAGSYGPVSCAGSYLCALIADRVGCKTHRCEVSTAAYVIRYTVVGIIPVAGRCDDSTFTQMHTTLSV